MPTYQYRCSECGYIHEEMQSIKAAPLVKCPKCGKDALKRSVGGGAGMIFKGQGFYLTDYKKTSAGGTTSSSSPTKEKPKKDSGPATPPPAEKKP